MRRYNTAISIIVAINTAAQNPCSAVLLAEWMSVILGNNTPTHDPRNWKSPLSHASENQVKSYHKMGICGAVEKVHLGVILSPPRRTKDLVCEKPWRIEIPRFAQNDVRSSVVDLSTAPLLPIWLRPARFS